MGQSDNQRQIRNAAPHGDGLQVPEKPGTVPAAVTKQSRNVNESVMPPPYPRCHQRAGQVDRKTLS
ncbi:hypothetical protein RGUI_0888 [Rhodovulum sp. P5]|nr:hypothetical protein RGUI_0888 [Rhodovulum sp. P5]